MDSISPGHGTEFTYNISLQVSMPLIENSPDAKSTVDGADFLNNYS